MIAQTPTCRVCNAGVLEMKTKYRMSVPVILIGYIFLIPSVLGMFVGGVTLFSAGADSAAACGISVFVIVASFVAGLFGWLLTMKKKVLQCSNCGAVVNAE